MVEGSISRPSVVSRAFDEIGQRLDTPLQVVPPEWCRQPISLTGVSSPKPRSYALLPIRGVQDF